MCPPVPRGSQATTRLFGVSTRFTGQTRGSTCEHRLSSTRARIRQAAAEEVTAAAAAANVVIRIALDFVEVELITALHFHAATDASEA